MTRIPTFGVYSPKSRLVIPVDTPFPSRRMKMSASKAFLVCLGIAVQPLSSFAQVVYDLQWSATGGSTISGVGQMTISGTPTSYNGSNIPSWLDSLSLNLTINGTSGYLADETDISTFEWSSTANPTSVSDISIFRFSATISGQVSGNFSLAPGTGSLEVIATPSGGSSQTMALTSFSAVPEPEEWAAIASTGLLAFGIWHRRSRKAAKA